MDWNVEQKLIAYDHWMKHQEFKLIAYTRMICVYFWPAFDTCLVQVLLILSLSSFSILYERWH